MLNRVLVLRKIEVRGESVVSGRPCLVEEREQLHSAPLLLLFPGVFSRGRWGNRCFTYFVIPHLMGRGATSFRT